MHGIVIVFGVFGLAVGLALYLPAESELKAAGLCAFDPRCFVSSSGAHLAEQWDAAKTRSAFGLLLAIAGGSTAVAGVVRGALSPQARSTGAGPGVACPECSRTNASGAHFCQNCGSAVRKP